MGKKKSNEYQSIISHIIERFLNPEMEFKVDDFDTLNDILELPISALKNVTKDEASLYESVFQISTIKSIAKLDLDNPFKGLYPQKTKEMQNEEYQKKVDEINKKALQSIPDLDKLKATIMIAKMIDRAWQKRSSYLEKKDSKVICVGLDNAGKTAILSSLGGKLGIKDLQNLKPTKQIERQKITTSDLELHVWDFGGQVEYRQVYLQNPEKFFLRTDLMMYVIDIQDPDRFKDSFAYFKEILDIMQRLSECPYILVFLHKCDPELIDDPEFQIHLDYAKNKAMEILSDYCMEYDIYITSIYNFFNAEPTFSKYIKEVMGNRISENNPMLMKIEGISTILETTLNAIVNLSSSVGEQMNEIDLRLRRLESDLARIKSEYLVDIPSAPGQKKPVPVAENSIYNAKLAKIADDTVRIKDDLENFNKLYQYSEKISTQMPKYQKTSQATRQQQPSQPATPAKPLEQSEADKQDLARLTILKNLQSLLKKK